MPDSGVARAWVVAVGFGLLLCCCTRTNRPAAPEAPGAVAGKGAAGTSGAAPSAPMSGSFAPELCFGPDDASSAEHAGQRGCVCDPARDTSRCVQRPFGGPVALFCVNGRWRVGIETEECPADSGCFDDFADPRCQTRPYTSAECAEAGGVVLAERDPGSLLIGACPGGRETIAVIADDETFGQLCCTRTTSCAPQAVEFSGNCDAASRYYWNGTRCEGLSGCSCRGQDCAAGFDNPFACRDAFAHCGLSQCGPVFARPRPCADDEYCAFAPPAECGASGAFGVCIARPESCDENYDPVCGCDGVTYGNLCAANAAGTGIASYGECLSMAER